jgi:multiple sugar transport system permease protein
MRIRRTVSKSLVRSRLSQSIWSLVRALYIAGVGFIILYPLLVKLSSAFMTEFDLFDPTVRWIPRHFTLHNLTEAFTWMKYPEAFRNTFTLVMVVSILQLASCTLVGYGLARYELRGGSILLGLVVFTLIVPPQMIMVPLYLNFRFFNLFGLLGESGINLLGTLWPLVLMSATGTGLRNGLYIYIMRQFFKGMPRDLEEAAYVDGAGPYRTFFSVMLPGTVPALVIVFLFSFVWQWNDMFYTSITMGNATLLSKTLTELGSQYSQYYKDVSTQYAQLLNNTGSLLFLAPLLILYAFMQRFFIESVERTGLVG